MEADKKNRSHPRPKAISELPYATLKRLADRLDMPCDGSLYWRKLITVMPGSPYDQLTVERFAMNAHRLDGSPAYALLTDMSNRGVSYDELVSYLKRMSFYAALHELGYRGEGGGEGPGGREGGVRDAEGGREGGGEGPRGREGGRKGVRDANGGMGKNQAICHIRDWGKVYPLRPITLQICSKIFWGFTIVHS